MDLLSAFGVDEERLTEIAKIHNESFIWYYNNLQKIQESNTGKFIAIYEKKIIESDKDKDYLFQKLREKYDDKKIEEIFINYVNPKGYVLY